MARSVSEFDMDIVHRAGRKHGNADALSRIQCKQCGYIVNWEEERDKISAERTVKSGDFQSDLLSSSKCR